MKTAIFPGSFDPFTLGHKDIIDRALEIFDKIIIGIGVNTDKRTMFSTEERLEQIKKVFENQPNIEVKSYEGLTTDFAKKNGANTIIRGIRTTIDFEYEKLIADLNLQTENIDTISFFTKAKYASIQSKAIRELIKYKKDISFYVPKEIKEIIQK